MLVSTSALLSLGSLLLGLTAWVVPIISIKRFEKYGIKKCCKSIIVSFAACVTSLCLQFFEINHRVKIGDLSAIMDTIGTLKWVAVILAVITLMLNMFALGICCDNGSKAR